MIFLRQNADIPRSTARLPNSHGLMGLAWVFLFLALAVPASAAKSSGGGDPKSLSAWVSALDRVRTQDWSIFVKDLATGEVVFQLNPDERLIPASNRKLLTFALALDKLGPEFQFRTELGYTGTLDRATGTIRGSLVLRSNGDPTMESRYLNGRNPASVIRSWLAGLASAGIKKVEGDFIIDASAFGPDQDSYPAAWDNRHRNNTYAAIPSAIALNGNLIRISVSPSDKSGARGRVSLFPGAEGISIDNDTQSVGGRREGLDARFRDDGRSLYLSGRIGQGIDLHVLALPLAAPVRFARDIAADAVKDAGIKISGLTRIVTDPAESRQLGEFHAEAWHESIPLVELLRIMLLNSDNFLAEQIWHATAFRATGDGSSSSARRLEEAWYAEHGLAGTKAGQDGCGLSSANGISSSELVAMLESVYGSPYQSYLLKCLPASGRTGTLGGRSLGTDPGRVIAKTGTLAGAMALSGFIKDKQGKPRWSFSMLSNAPGDTNGALTVRGDQFMKILVEILDSGQKPGAAPEVLITDKKYRPGTKRLVENPS